MDAYMTEHFAKHGEICISSTLKSQLLLLFLLLLLLLVLPTAKMDAYMAETIRQTRWEMHQLASENFPKNAAGQPELAYYFPQGALITQVGCYMLC
jgi:hypothetical protein